MDAERKRLKEFIEQHIPFDELKKAGAMAGVRKTDYEKIAAWVCWHFGFKSIYEYDPPEIIDVPHANAAIGSFPDKIDTTGNYQKGDGFLICTIQGEFDCPICTCHQSIRDSKTPVFTQKCKGCKRKLQIFSCPMTGNLTVSEVSG